MYLNKQMTEETQVETMELGICVNCNEVDSCIHLAKSSSPIWDCNEYDASYGSMPMVLGKPKATEDSKPAASEFKGLCVNCEKRFDCVFAITNGGVWHCNEYE